MPIKLIVGLRNPGAAYAQTRHNAGEWFVEALAEQYKLSFSNEKKLQGECTQLTIDNNTCTLLLPTTFMNHAGLPVSLICQYFQINTEDILIAHDELDLPVGCSRLKQGGGHGGHNGLRDVIKHLGGSDFNRLRIGIGHPGHKELVINYVLGKPSIQDKQCIMTAINNSVDVLPNLLKGEMAIAMNKLHS